MNVRKFPSRERFSASSDFELKLVTIWVLSLVIPRSRLFGTSRELNLRPNGVISSRKIRDVIPKLASTGALLNTKGYNPLFTAVTHPPVEGAHSGGSAWPTLTLAARLS